MNVDKLKKCPMCGSETTTAFMDVFDSESPDATRFRTMCRSCGLMTAQYRTGAEAITAWNRRAEPDSPPKCVYCDDSKRDAEGMRSFDAILVPTHCGQCGRKFDNE